MTTRRTTPVLNPVLLIDGYKIDHRRQYPDGTQRIYANWTARGSRITGQDEVMFFGFQYLAQRYLEDEMQEFFAANVEDVCVEYVVRVNGYLGPNAIGTEHIRALHALGYVPLEFRAVPEGTMVPLRVPMMTIENTHADFAWVTNYFETMISTTLWGMCTSATTSFRLRTLFDCYAVMTGSPPEFVPYQGHDFSMRGMFGVDAAAMSGAGHLVNFVGTDTVPAIDLVEWYYNMDHAGASVAATEHSVMCAGIGYSNELETFERVLDLYPEGIVSIVSDTDDFWGVLTSILPRLKARILARDGKVVIRPDSGDPYKIICGDYDVPRGTPASLGAIQMLWDLFGGTITSTGHKLLDSHIGVIYGDSIDYGRAESILATLDANGFASTNIVFGVGSFTYQYVTRDTYNFAMKTTWCQINDQEYDIFKKPATDTGMKFSSRGRIAVVRDEINGRLKALEGVSIEEETAISLLTPVWRDGSFVSETNFEDIRALAKTQRELRTGVMP